MLQDAWRFAFFAQGKGSKALINDVIATVLLLPTLVVLDGVDRATVAWFVLAWGGTATVAAIVGIAQSRVLPRPRRIIAWWNRHRDLSGWFLGEFAVVQGAQSVSLFVLIAVTTLETIGSLRAAATLFGPINILLMAIGLIAVPEGARAIAHSQQRLRIFVIVISLAMVLSAGALGAALLMVPREVGVRLLGDNWDVARPLVVLQMIFVAASAGGAGPRTGLWALGAAKLTFVGRVWASLFTATLPALGALTVGGAVGIYWGAILGEVIAVSLWVRQYRSAEKQRLEADAATQQVEG
jgi:O-antigen/teichoic acid export membrane protein